MFNNFHPTHLKLTHKSSQQFTETANSEVFKKKLKNRSLAVFENVNSILGDSKLTDQELIKTNPLFYNMNKHVPIKHSNLSSFNDEAKLLEVKQLAFPKKVKDRDLKRRNIIKKIFGKVKIKNGDTLINSLRNLKTGGLKLEELVKKGIFI